MFDINDFIDEDGDGQPDPPTDQDDETDDDGFFIIDWTGGDD